ncbi:MAG: hypothetical protein AMXMBFR84_12830 [Candidatus Hydrogenedentota bacterium]
MTIAPDRVSVNALWTQLERIGTMARMTTQRLSITPRLRERMAYVKFKGPTPRMLVLRSQYWLDGACLRAAESLGWQVTSVPTVMEGVLSKKLLGEFIAKVFEFRPDFILCVNFGGLDLDGIIANFLFDLNLPFVVWVVDDPRTILMDTRTQVTDNTVVLTWDRAYISYLSGLGFKHIHWIPLATDTTLFNSEPPGYWSRSPSFVGNSMVDFSHREWLPLLHQPVLKTFVEYAFAEGLVTRDRFGEGIEAILGSDIVSALDAETRRRVEMIFFIEGTRRLRHAIVERLASEGLTVYGDEGWSDILCQSGGWIGYEAELPAFYRECPLNLNVTSIQMPNAVNQRVFDCPAAGGFLLTDNQPDLDVLFSKDSETAVYHSLEDCVEKFRFYMNNPRARTAITERARTRILEEHTYAHRLWAIEGILKSIFAS